MKKSSPRSPVRDNYYPNAPTPYNAPYGSGPYGDDYDSGGGEYGGDYGAGQRHNPLWLEEVAQVKVEFGADYFDKAPGRAWRPAIQMELLRLSF